MAIAYTLYVWAASHILHFSAGLCYVYIHTHVFSGISWEGGIGGVLPYLIPCA